MNIFNAIIVEAVMSPEEVEIIAEAFSDVYHELSTKHQKSTQLTIVGDPEEYTEIQDIFNRWAISSILQFIPETDQARVTRILKKGSILLVPNDQNIKKLIKLSLKHHLPILTLDTETNREYLDHTCSMLLEPGDYRAIVHALTECLDILVHDPEVTKYLRKGAENQYYDRFTWRKETA